jgi:hypothetical protein
MTVSSMRLFNDELLLPTLAARRGLATATEISTNLQKSVPGAPTKLFK